MQKTLIILTAICVLTCLSTGCVKREILIDSEPRGAMVYLNDEEIGRTPTRVNFTWYGVYDIRLEKQGYETVQTLADVEMPWWEIPPADLIVEVLPTEIGETYRFKYTLNELDLSDTDIRELIKRGQDLRYRMETDEQREARIQKELATTQPANPEENATQTQPAE